jgi:hypothetical protein
VHAAHQKSRKKSPQHAEVHVVHLTSKIAENAERRRG